MPVPAPPKAAARRRKPLVIAVGVVVAMLVAVRLVDAPARTRRAWTWVLVVTLAQGVVGYVQYFTGLPEAVVAAPLPVPDCPGQCADHQPGQYSGRNAAEIGPVRG